MKSLRAFLLWAAIFLVFASSSAGEVFLSQEEALKLAFPNTDKIEKKTFFMTSVQKQKVEFLSGANVSSKLFTFFVGEKDGKILGYAAFDVHTVRTLPEAFLILLTPEGDLKDIFLLAFYEPKEYLPSKRWLEQFRGKTLSPDLRVGRKVHGIAGSTLTSWAVTGAVRKVLALYQVLIVQGGG